jgi:hypothetical protein
VVDEHLIIQIDPQTAEMDQQSGPNTSTLSLYQDANLSLMHVYDNSIILISSLTAVDVAFLGREHQKSIVMFHHEKA